MSELHYKELKFCGIEGCGKSSMFGDKFAPMCKSLQHLKIRHICKECAEIHKAKLNNKKKEFGGLETASMCR